MSASGFVMLTTDELGRATGLSAMADGEFITSAIIPSAITPFVINQANGQVEFEGALPADTTVSFGDGDFVQTNGKVISRFIHAANELSAAPTCLTRLEGTVSALSGISVSGPEGVSSNDAGKSFYMRRDNSASYRNLIRAEDSTITLQAEDDIHLKSNTGEDFARFNENAAVWLYYDNSKKIETHTGGAVVNGTLSATTGMESSGCPIPNPFGYMQLDGDGTDSVDETNLGAGATVTNIVSNTDHISWNDTGKYFNVSAAGVYEVLGVVILEGGSTLVDLSIQKNGSDVLVGQPRVHSTVDPLEHTIRAVFTCAASDYVSITYDATASNSVKAITGSTMSVKRLK